MISTIGVGIVGTGAVVTAGDGSGVVKLSGEGVGDGVGSGSGVTMVVETGVGGASGSVGVGLGSAFCAGNVELTSGSGVFSAVDGVTGEFDVVSDMGVLSGGGEEIVFVGMGSVEGGYCLCV